MSGKSKKKKGTKSQLEYVEKEFKWHVSRIKYRNAKQKECVQMIEDHVVNFISGSAGTAKTFLSVYCALKALEKGEVEKITLIKPMTAVGKIELGALPGDERSKADPYLYSFYDQFDQLIGKETRNRLIKDEKIEIIPIQLLRGRSLRDRFIIADELQNCDYETLKTIITRIAEGSKYVLLGDEAQIDLKRKSESALKTFVDVFRDDDKVGSFEFTEEDVVRHPIITHILNKLKEIENK